MSDTVIIEKVGEGYILTVPSWYAPTPYKIVTENWKDVLKIITKIFKKEERSE